jgi:hypothetical protein
MGFFFWFSENWFILLQSLAIIAGLLFTAFSFRLDAKTRRVSNLLEITKQHREIWTELYQRPELARISQKDVDLKIKPLTPEEELFIGFLILHLNSSYHAIKDGVFTKPEGLRKDIQQFFARPMAKMVWEKMKPFQDEDFVRFVEAKSD